ncbi:hypothetical protein [Modestobacter roseus]|uniref:Uncharacterized protein n=1 Tax=Modestobacter roseus TaxID=1181884 RepID=A0A562IT67_9ACTN|nr:hypothetical protein [Modestobacter roseus]MQA34871.1 hypothetical protein [Modestobacter roseus]TWH74026.1 hypothetical protein JD78_02558 [Modestobacter roseus]
MRKRDLAGPLRPTAVDALPGDRHAPLPADALEWSWPPYAPVEGRSFAAAEDDWAPPSVVWHPQVRLGRWTVVYRRSA